MDLEFEPALIELTRQNVICLRVLVVLMALLYVDRLWALTKQVFKHGIWAGVVLVCCVPTFGQSFTAKIAGADVVVLPVLQARYASAGTWTVSSASSFYPGGLAYGTNPTATWFLEWKIDLAPGVYKVYGIWGRQNGSVSTVFIPDEIAVSSAPMVNNEYRSPQAIKDLDETSNGLQPSDVSVEWKENGTIQNAAKGMGYVGEIVVWSGSRYVAMKSAAQPGGHHTYCGSFVLQKVRDVPLWQKYIGGDVDTSGYFENLKPSDAVSAVCLPVESVMKIGTGSPTYANANMGDGTFEENVWQIDQNFEDLTQQGVVSRYVQVKFTDARYTETGMQVRYDVGQPSFGWIISLGRNGGLTARTARCLPARYAYRFQVSGWIQTDVGAGGGGPLGQWVHEQQWRDMTRFPLMTAGGYRDGGNSFSHDAKYLSRFPYADPDWFGLPVIRGAKVNGSGVNGNTAPTTALATIGHPVLSSSNYAADGTTASLYELVTVPTGFDRDNSILLRPYGLRLRYPLHVNHLRCFVEAMRRSPSEDADIRRFVELVDAWVAMCDGHFTPAEYRVQIARSAADAVTLEDEETDISDAPDQASIRPTLPSVAPTGDFPNRSNPFSGAFPSGGTGMEWELDLNIPFSWVGIASDPDLVLVLNSDPLVMKAQHAGPWAEMWQEIDDWRFAGRTLLLFIMTVLVFWDKVNTVWSEL